MPPTSTATKEKKSSIFGLLRPYMRQIIFLASLAIASSGLGLILPKIISHAIDAFVQGRFVTKTFVLEFGAVTLGIFLFTYLQSIMQIFTAERVAKDLRATLAAKISEESYEAVERRTPAKLLTNLTSDVDSIKMFVGQAVVSLISSVVIVIGAGILLLTIDWKLGLAVLAVVPIIAALFSFIFKRVRTLMKRSREVIDWLNKVINESVLGAALIRVLHSQTLESEKFKAANGNAREIGIGILKMFATLIPAITFVSNMAMLIVVALGGHFVIGGSMSLGDFTAFMSYISLFIFPLLVVGIIGNVISQSQASYDRIREVLDAEVRPSGGSLTMDLVGQIELKDVSVSYGERVVLKDVSFVIEPKTKTAIIGPTAAGKTQLLFLLTRLTRPERGEILIDGKPIESYEAASLHKQIGFVFQDSIIFNLSLRENIAFGGQASEVELEKAIATAELSDFINTLPQGLDTVISERGASLSGGQKQRIMLARALCLNPKILLLDDFTARVDNNTEAKVIKNLERNYPSVTLVSVTQRIAPIEHYDEIVLLMEGEMVAHGTHDELLKSSPEYAQIYDSQKSTNRYE